MHNVIDADSYSVNTKKMMSVFTCKNILLSNAFPFCLFDNHSSYFLRTFYTSHGKKCF